MENLKVDELMDDSDVQWAVDGVFIDELRNICECINVFCEHIADKLKEQNKSISSNAWFTDNHIGQWLFSNGKVLKSKDQWLEQL